MPPAFLEVIIKNKSMGIDWQRPSVFQIKYMCVINMFLRFLKYTFYNI